MSTTINVTNWFEVPVKMSLNIWVLNIPTLSPQFVFGFTTPAYNLYDRCGTLICIYLIIGSSSSGSCNSSNSSNLFRINNTNICMPILENQGKQTEVCTHAGC